MTRKIKLLIYVSTLSEGGAERQVSYLLNHLDRERFEIILCLSRKKIDYFIPDDITVYCFDKKHFWDLARISLRLKQIIVENNIDIVFSTLFNCNIACLLQKLLIGKKLKLVIRESIDPSWYKQLRFPLVFLLPMKLFYPLTDKIISPSLGTMHSLQNVLKSSSNKFYCIHNMVDINYIKQCGAKRVNLLARGNEARYVVFVGRLDTQKRIDYLFHAFKIINSKLDNIHLLIIGEGPEKANLEKLSTDLGIGRKTYILGYQKNPFKYMLHSDVYASSSLFEGLSNATIEAMAIGVPVVTTKITGNDEIIDDGQCGFMVPARDPAALAEKVITLLEDAELRSKFSAQGKKKVKDKFSIERGIKTFEDVFLTIFQEGI